MNKQTTMPRTPAARAYQRSLRRALDDLLDVMEQTWGFRPCVSVTVEPALVVQANFEIEGFEHKGQRTWLKAQSACGRRTPRKVARQIAAEISGHRNTCKECGTGIPPIWQRAHGWKDVSIGFDGYAQHKQTRHGVSLDLLSLLEQWPCAFTSPNGVARARFLLGSNGPRYSRSATPR